MHRRSFVNICNYQTSTPFHCMSKVCEYGNHQFLPNRTHRDLYGLVPGGSCLPFDGSVESVFHLHPVSSLSPHSYEPVVQKMPSRFCREAGYSLVSQEETPQGPAAVERMLVDVVECQIKDSCKFLWGWGCGPQHNQMGTLHWIM